MKDYLQHLLTWLALVLLSVTAQAQKSIQGTVVNQQNQPVEGARVARRTFTDKDGHFTLREGYLPRRLRVRHTDYNINVVPVPEDGRMFIRLDTREEEPWDEHAWHPFVALNMGSIFSEGGLNDPFGGQRWGVTCRTLGVMGGMMDDRFGFYGRGHFLPIGDSDGFDIRSRHNAFDFAVGGIVHVWSPICLYAGAGIMFYTEDSDRFRESTDYYRTQQFSIHEGRIEDHFNRIFLDAGLLLRGQKDFLPHWMLTIGVFTPFERYSIHPNVGIGYIF